MRAYFGRIWFVVDILINVICGGAVETISSNFGRKLLEKRRCVLCRPVCWLLSRWWPDHCIHNIMEPLNK